jgi:hypothetical protein
MFLVAIDPSFSGVEINVFVSRKSLKPSAPCSRRRPVWP